MAETADPPEVAPKKKSKRPMIIGLVLALLLGGGGFYATYSGMILAPPTEDHGAEAKTEALPDIAFVPIEPVIISLGAAARNMHLQMASQLEVAKPYAEEVTMLMPRIQDVLNGYLRAVDVAQLEDPAALVRLRAQLLRRIQIVTGDGRVRDFLITEFVLN